MPEYRKSDGKAVEHKLTKYDGFFLVKTKEEYRHQKGSGRSQCFSLAKDGMTIGAWAKLCAKRGFDSKFVIGSLVKLSGTDKPGWAFSEKNDKGQTLADIKKVRDVDPAKAAIRDAKLKAAAEAKTKKAAEKKIAGDKKTTEAKAKKAAEKKKAA